MCYGTFDAALHFARDGDTLTVLHVRVSPGMISSADGSALVKLGKTVVLAGVRCEPTLPAEAEPACGQVHVRCAGGCTHDA